MTNRLVFLFIAFFALFPLAVLAVYTVAPGWTWPQLVPEELSYRGLVYLANHASDIGSKLLSSMAYSFCTVLLSLILCIMPAHHFARCRFTGKRFLEGLLLAPALVPSMTFSMGVHVMFIHAGLADTFPGVVLVLTLFSYPYMLRALVAGYQAVGPEYEQCAANLGASPLRIFLKVELPLLIPAVVAGASIVFLVAFSEYFLVFLIGGGAVDSYTGYLFPFLNSSDRSVGSALTLLFLAVPISLFFAVEYLTARVYRGRGMY